MKSKSKNQNQTGGIQLSADISKALTAHAGRRSKNPRALIEKTLLRQLDGQEQITIPLSEGELLRLKRAAEFTGGNPDSYIRIALLSMIELDEDVMESQK